MEKSTFTREYQLLCTLVREFRERAGLTQVQLAERLGETQSFVSKSERGGSIWFNCESFAKRAKSHSRTSWPSLNNGCPHGAAETRNYSPARVPRS